MINSAMAELSLSLAPFLLCHLKDCDFIGAFTPSMRSSAWHCSLFLSRTGVIEIPGGRLARLFPFLSLW